MKITKRTREQAALICAIAASNGCGVFVICDSIGIDDRARSAYLARDAFYQSRKPKRWRLRFAEAESKLRCGWSP